MNVSRDLYFKKAFYVKDEQSPNAILKLALDPKIFYTETGDEKISWQDDLRGRQFACKKITYLNNQDQNLVDSEHPPKEIKVTDKNDRNYTLGVLTCDVYYNKMKNFLNIPKYNEDDQLQKFFATYDPLNESYRKMFS